jgi:hypothetical protein
MGVWRKCNGHVRGQERQLYALILSSLYGARDWTTSSGRLCFPDTPDIRTQIEANLATMYRLGQPLCYVEMSTPARLKLPLNASFV